jgi:phosphohistidine phosphatase SixA
MRLFCLRHGATDACENTDKSVNKDVSLNLAGVDQVLATGRLFGERLRRVRLVLVSPTRRTEESAALLRLAAPLARDDRLHNKKSSDGEYAAGLLSLLQDVAVHGDVLLCTHGRIVKMLYSILVHGGFRQDVIDGLVLSYGSMTVFRLDETAAVCEVLDNDPAFLAA